MRRLIAVCLLGAGLVFAPAPARANLGGNSKTYKTAAKAARSVGASILTNSRQVVSRFTARDVTARRIGASNRYQIQPTLSWQDGTPKVIVKVHKTPKGFTAVKDGRVRLVAPSSGGGRPAGDYRNAGGGIYSGGGYGAGGGGVVFTGRGSY